MASPKTKKPVTKKPVTKKIAKSKKTAPLKPESTEPELAATPEVEVPRIEDPIGDETDGEAEIAVDQKTASALYQGTTSVVPQAKQKKGRALAPESEPEAAAEPEFTPQPRPPAKLERLQKILAAAGVASRRSAEAIIEQGRVQVNGKVVTVLGTKADAGRDHIRVDGKLLQGPERHRYFVLNKPRGFVTTVKDPEGRPTVMQFFDKMKERLYPVGRLDYMSEGLLVVTNDGELANRLTKASSGVEKTYLIKVAGQPTEAELNILRGGVSIERGKPGSPPVRTSPARIRQVRQGDNPWYEVVLIEGRNRELRKMFEEVGHFVEKIRRVGYGPLVLDQEPGGMRELEPQELDALRLAAEGKLRTPKSKDLRRRNLLDAGLLPTVLPKPSGRPADSFASGEANKLFRPVRPGDIPPKKFGADRAPRTAGSFDKGAGKPFRPTRATGEGFHPAAGRSFDRPPARPASHPAWKKEDRPAPPPARFAADSTGESRPEVDRPSNYRPRKFDAGRPFTVKPAWKKPERPAPSHSDQVRSGPARPASRPAWKKDDHSARPDYKSPAAPRRETPVREARVFDEDLGPVRPPNLHIEEITGPDRSSTPRSSYSRPSAPRSYPDRSGSDRPRPSRSGFERTASSTRPFTTSSGKPRAGGARPSSKSGPGWKPKTRYGPGKPASAPSRPFTPRTEGASDYRPTKAKPYPNSDYRAERKAGPAWKPKSGVPTDRSSSVGWKPKTRYGPGKPASGSRSKPRPGSSAKPSHRVKPGVPTNRSSSVGWKSGGKKRR
jgi:23S rRNA pseudouridine2605 synthase